MRLPVSGLEVRFRAPDGNDDLAILEAAGSALERALSVLPRLAWVGKDAVESVAGDGRGLGRDGDRDSDREWGRAPDGNRAVWTSLTVTDFETALLGVRRYLFGDRVSCLLRGASHRCGVRMELEFSITAFLQDARPSVPSGMQASGTNPRWFQLNGKTGGGENPVRFRLPSVGDQVIVQDEPHAAASLARRCVDLAGGEKLRARTMARAEHAMETMAPLVSRSLEGSCPECGEPVSVYLHVPRLVMDELEASAAGIHEEIHSLAAAYHWDEASILAMPQRRRRAYAETIRRREQVVG